MRQVQIYLLTIDHEDVTHILFVVYVTLKMKILRLICSINIDITRVTSIQL